MCIAVPVIVFGFVGHPPLLSGKISFSEFKLMKRETCVQM